MRHHLRSSAVIQSLDQVAQLDGVIEHRDNLAAIEHFIGIQIGLCQFKHGLEDL